MRHTNSTNNWLRNRKLRNETHMRNFLIVIIALIVSCRNYSEKSIEDKTMDSLEVRLTQWRDLKTVKPVLDSSPAIGRLKGANKDEINKFWDSIAFIGTPMVEKGPDSNSLLITFLYSSSGQTGGVRLDIKNVYLGNGGSDMTLIPIKNSDIWYRTFKIPVDWTTSYKYEVSGESGTKSVTDEYNRNLIPVGLDTSYSYNAFDYLLDSSKVWFFKRDGVPNGTLAEFSIESKILKNSRSVVVYKPAGYDEKMEYPAIVVFDQFLYLERVPMTVILDNLIAANKIPPCVAILIDNQPTERRSKELPLYKPFADFIGQEIMPWAYQNFSITKDPGKTIVAGVSYGGLASSYIAFYYSNLFGNVLSQSGSYWRGVTLSDSIPRLIEQYKISEKLPVRFYLDCGLQETNMRTLKNINFIERHRYMRDVLKSKGYEVYYQEFQSGHDWSGWRKTLPDGLMILFEKMGRI